MPDSELLIGIVTLIVITTCQYLHCHQDFLNDCQQDFAPDRQIQVDILILTATTRTAAVEDGLSSVASYLTSHL